MPDDLEDVYNKLLMLTLYEDATTEELAYLERLVRDRCPQWSKKIAPRGNASLLDRSLSDVNR